MRASVRGLPKTARGRGGQVFSSFPVAHLALPPGPAHRKRVRNREVNIRTKCSVRQRIKRDVVAVQHSPLRPIPVSPAREFVIGLP